MSTHLDGRGRLKATPEALKRLTDAGFEYDPDTQELYICDGASHTLKALHALCDAHVTEVEEIDCRFENEGEEWRTVKDAGVVYVLGIAKVALLPRHKKLLIGLLAQLPMADRTEILNELELEELEEG